MKKNLILAQVGCGYWGPNLLRVFRELEGSRVKWLCDLDQARLDWAAGRYPDLRLTRDFEEILRDPEVDAVIVATVVVTHHKLARAALAAGKHVFVEKPLAHSAGEARDLAALAARRNLSLGVGHVFLYHPAVSAIKAQLSSGRLGRLCYMDFTRVNPGPPAPKHDVFWDMAPHDVALAIDAAGEPPRWVRATGRRYRRSRVDEAGFMEMGFSRNVLARIHVGWLSSRRVRRVDVYAERGSLFFDDMEAFEKLRIVSPGEDTRAVAKGGAARHLYYGAGDILIPALPPGEPLRAECADFLDSLRRRRQPRSGPKIGVEVVEVLEAAAKSAARGSRVEELR